MAENGIQSIADKIAQFEVVRSDRFRFYIDDVGGVLGALGPADFEMSVEKMSLPTETSELIELVSGVETTKYAGKITWGEQSIIVRDFVDTTTAAFIRNWRLKVYDPDTGRVGYKKAYSGTARVQLLSPSDSVIREWKFLRIWPQEVAYGEVNLTTNDPVQITVKFAYDKVKVVPIVV